MADTVIYISITHDNATLTLDGNLYLFGELLTTLHDAAREVSQAKLANILPAEDAKQTDGKSNAT